MTFGSLFAGIGGMDLGLERAGMECAWQVEIDDYARRVLAKHWPDVRRHDDVKTFPPTAPEDWHCDIICGGFPCQDISNAGKRAGIDGARSGLWSEYARIIRVVRPRYVLVENVSALLHRGLGRVLGDLAEIGYDAEWDCIPAAAFGFPHFRDRIFLLASNTNKVDVDSFGEDSRFGKDAHDNRVSGKILQAVWEFDSSSGRPFISGDIRYEVEHESRVARVAHGISNRMDRFGGCGNAVVPQVTEYIGRMIAAHAEGR